MIKRQLVILLALVCMSTQSLADNSDAISCFNNRNFICSLELFESRALKGDRIAQFYAALQYERGLGAERDYNQAVRFYTLAAEQGLMEAANNLAVIYEEGYLGSPNIDHALAWYRVAAENDDASAQYNLALLLFLQPEADKRKEGMRWLVASAKASDIQAQQKLGEVFLNGDLVARDIKRATKWLRKAANAGAMSSQLFLARMFLNGEGVEKNIAEAIDWYKLAAEQNSVSAQYQLGIIYGQQGAQQNLPESIRWLERAAKNNHVQAQYRLGSVLIQDTSSSVARDQGKNWLNKACNNGVRKACRFAAQ